MRIICESFLLGLFTCSKDCVVCVNVYIYSNFSCGNLSSFVLIVSLEIIEREAGNCFRGKLILDSFRGFAEIRDEGFPDDDIDWFCVFFFQCGKPS